MTDVTSNGTIRPKSVPRPTQSMEDAFPHASLSDIHDALQDILAQQARTNELLKQAIQALTKK